MYKCSSSRVDSFWEKWSRRNVVYQKLRIVCPWGDLQHKWKWKAGEDLLVKTNSIFLSTCSCVRCRAWEQSCFWQAHSTTSCPALLSGWQNKQKLVICGGDKIRVLFLYTMVFRNFLMQLNCKWNLPNDEGIRYGGPHIWWSLVPLKCNSLSPRARFLIFLYRISVSVDELVLAMDAPERDHTDVGVNCRELSRFCGLLREGRRCWQWRSWPQ